MIDLSTNIDAVVLQITSELNDLGDKDKVARVVAQSMVTIVHDRIHEQGKDSAGGQIGEYKNSYLALREKRNRTNDKKVILSLTRQMENDLSIVDTADGYGIGYKNDLNYKKSEWAEKNYNKKIFDLTDEEKQQAVTVAEFETDKILND